jgi:hypothetical protein
MLTTHVLDGVVQRGLGVGRGLMDSHRAVEPSCTVVVSMASLLRGFALFYHSGVGFAEREVEVTSKACAQDAFFEFFRESTLAISKAQGSVFSSSVVLVWWFVDTYVW